MIFEILLRFEIGCKFAGTDGSRLGFLRMGDTEACLNFDGKMPLEKERLAR